MIRKILKIATQEQYEFCNITKEIKDFVTENKIHNAMVSIRTFHTSSAIYINEDEPGLLKDVLAAFASLLPEDKYYFHDDFSIRKFDATDKYWGRKNAFSHLRAMMLGAGITIPVFEEKLSLGKHQSVLFFELDGPRDDRQVELVIFSEEKK